MAKFGLLFNFCWFSGWKIFISMYHPPMSYSPKWAINKTENKAKTWRSTKLLAMSLKVPNLFASIWGSLQKWHIDKYGMYSSLTNWQKWDMIICGGLLHPNEAWSLRASVVDIVKIMPFYHTKSLLYYFTTSFYNISFIRCFIIPFYTLK